MMHWYNKLFKKEDHKTFDRRLGTEDQNVVIFDECQSQNFHGYVAEWGELTDQQRILLYSKGRCTTMKIDQNEKL